MIHINHGFCRRDRTSKAKNALYRNRFGCHAQVTPLPTCRFLVNYGAKTDGNNHPNKGNMSTPMKKITEVLLVVGLFTALTSGCKCPYKSPQTGGGNTGSGGSATNFLVSGNFGSLNPDVTSFINGNNGQGCFPTSDGWDKYYPLPGYFLGPNTTPPTPNPYPNSGNNSFITIDTCAPENGTTLETGVVIMYEFNPADKVCASTSSCVDSSKLTICTRSMATGKRYRAAVFYKSATLGGLQKIKINWSYHD